MYFNKTYKRRSYITCTAVSVIYFIISMTCPNQTSMSKRVDLVRFRNKSCRLSGMKRRANVWKNVLDDICDQCSLHGLNHIIRNDRSTVEKLVYNTWEKQKKNIKISINIISITDEWPNVLSINLNITKYQIFILNNYLNNIFINITFNYN